MAFNQSDYNVKSLMTRYRCKIGLHKWKRTGNLVSPSDKCIHCGVIRWRRDWFNL